MKLTARFGVLATLLLGLTVLPGLIPAPAQAHARQSLRWAGRVDSVVDVYFRAGRSWVQTLTGRKKPDAGITHFYAPLPKRNVLVALEKTMGRGSVELRQQPTAKNKFTTVVRIRDPRSAAGRYKFSLLWDN